MHQQLCISFDARPCELFSGNFVINVLSLSFWYTFPCFFFSILEGGIAGWQKIFPLPPPRHPSPLREPQGKWLRHYWGGGVSGLSPWGLAKKHPHLDLLPCFTKLKGFSRSFLWRFALSRPKCQHFVIVLPKMTTHSVFFYPIWCEALTNLLASWSPKSPQNVIGIVNFVWRFALVKFGLPVGGPEGVLEPPPSCRSHGSLPPSPPQPSPRPQLLLRLWNSTGKVPRFMGKVSINPDTMFVGPSRICSQNFLIPLESAQRHQLLGKGCQSSTEM